MTMTIRDLLTTAADIQHQSNDRSEVCCTEMTPCVFCQAIKPEPCDECSGTRWPNEKHETHCSLYVEIAPEYLVEFDGKQIVQMRDFDETDADTDCDPLVSANYPDRGLVARSKVEAMKVGETIGFNAGAGGLGSITRVAVVALMLISLAGLSGCQRSVEPKAAAVSKACATDTDCEKAPRTIHYCKGVTVTGQHCKRHVKADGDYCSQHEIQSNPCWQPKGSKPVEDCYYKDGDVTRPIEGRP